MRSGAALFTFDERQTVLSWNRAAEELTGLRADDVVGRSCWDVLCAHDDAGGLVCHTGCSFHRLLRERWPVAPPTLLIRTADGRKRVRVRVPMVAVEDADVFAALLLEDTQPASESTTTDAEARPPELTPRQALVLAMLADGKQARPIAAELGLSEMTVRNHIRAILRAFGCSSQLSAVAKARRLGLV
jgi:DNA-binding CsgD family transcriptional regulator